MLPALIMDHQQEVEVLCRELNVQRLDVFGSATMAHFSTTTSDLDFVVTFADESFGTLADRYFSFAEALEQIFQRRVDVLTERSIRNPYFRRAVDKARQRVYERQAEEAPA